MSAAAGAEDGLDYRKAAYRAALLIGMLYLPYFLRHIIFSALHIDYLVAIPDNVRLFSKILALQIASVMLLFFILHNRSAISGLALGKIDRKSFLKYTIISYLGFCAYYGVNIAANKYEFYQGIAPAVIIILHALTLTVFVAGMALACFGTGYLKKIYRSTKPQPEYFFAGTVILTVLVAYFQGLWPYFSRNITIILNAVFSGFFDTSYSLAGRTPLLQVSGFKVLIEAPCSGIESMLLFLTFATGIFFLDYSRIRKGRYILISAAGFIGVYFVNILRLILLMLVGIYISPDFAVGLFHTNVGWLLFVIYFLAYYGIIKKFIYKKQESNKDNK